MPLCLCAKRAAHVETECRLVNGHERDRMDRGEHSLHRTEVARKVQARQHLQASSARAHRAQLRDRPEVQISEAQEHRPWLRAKLTLNLDARHKPEAGTQRSADLGREGQ